jgi:hypothetical protein
VKGEDDTHAQARISLGRIIAALEELGRAHGEVFRGIDPAARSSCIASRMPGLGDREAI